MTKRGREVIDGVYPENLRAEAPITDAELSTEGQEVIWPDVVAVLQVIDLPRLVRSAEHANVIIELRVAPGETIFEGSVVGVVHGRRADRLDPEILGALAMGVERTFEQDPAFALRILADISLRSLSPAVNDPTTAVQALDGLESLLRLLGGRELAVGPITDANGNLRVVVKLPPWEEYVGLALDEIISVGLSSIQVGRRVERLLENLVALAPPQRQASVMRRLMLVRASANAAQSAGRLDHLGHSSPVSQ